MIETKSAVDNLKRLKKLLNEKGERKLKNLPMCWQGAVQLGLKTKQLKVKNDRVRIKSS